MCEDYRPHQHAYRAYFFLSRSHIAYIFPHPHAKVKFGLSEKHTKFEKILPHGFDKSADLLSKCQNHGEDFFQIMCASQKIRTLRKQFRTPALRFLHQIAHTIPHFFSFR